MSSEVGLCAGCLLRAELRDSHVLSKFAYRRHERHGPTIEVRDGAARFQARQRTERLLCDACEQITGDDETAVSAWCWSSGSTSPALDEVRAHRFVNSPGRMFADGSGLPVDALCRVAMGVVFKAHASRTFANTSLGPYADPFREFVFDSGPYPLDVVLCLDVLEPSKSVPAPWGIFPPETKAHPSPGGDRFRAHFFQLPGLLFHVLVGRAVPEGLRRSCFHKTRCVRITDREDAHRIAAELLKNANQSRGLKSWLASNGA